MSKILVLLFMTSFCYAKTTISIFDNQINTSHPKLKDHIWNNSGEVLDQTDSDNNGYIDDINGWSFIDQTFNDFDQDQLDQFPSNVYKYYEIRAKKTLGTISDIELEWYNTIRKDEEFKEIKSKFTKYIHGTHISCIALDNTNLPPEISKNDFTIIPIRYLGKAAHGPFVTPVFSALEIGSEEEKLNHLKNFYKNYSIWMLSKLKLATDYIKNKAQVVNSSWGQSFTGSTYMINSSFKEQFGDKHSYENLVKDMAASYLESLIAGGSSILKKHRNTLFIFSAGNKKENTDEKLHYPSSITLKNVISVGASSRDNKKASFSNFGKETVSLFAPGEAIESCDPNGLKVKINGTSQAAPYVTSTARILFELANRYSIKVTPSKIKQILINTVNKKTELQDMAKSSGIINPKRAFKALKLLSKYSMKKSISLSHKYIRK